VRTGPQRANVHCYASPVLRSGKKKNRGFQIFPLESRSLASQPATCSGAAMKNSGTAGEGAWARLQSNALNLDSWNREVEIAPSTLVALKLIINSADTGSQSSGYWRASSRTLLTSRTSTHRTTVIRHLHLSELIGVNSSINMRVFVGRCEATGKVRKLLLDWTRRQAGSCACCGDYAGSVPGSGEAAHAVGNYPSRFEPAKYHADKRAAVLVIGFEIGASLESGGMTQSVRAGWLARSIHFAGTAMGGRGIW